MHSVAEALVLFLESTAEPLIPYNLHSVCISVATNYLQCKEVRKDLPFYGTKGLHVHFFIVFLSFADCNATSRNKKNSFHLYMLFFKGVIKSYSRQ